MAFKKKKKNSKTKFKYQLNPLKCLPLWVYVFTNLAVFFLTEWNTGYVTLKRFMQKPVPDLLHLQ